MYPDYYYLLLSHIRGLFYFLPSSLNLCAVWYSRTSRRSPPTSSASSTTCATTRFATPASRPAASSSRDTKTVWHAGLCKKTEGGVQFQTYLVTVTPVTVTVLVSPQLPKSVTVRKVISAYSDTFPSSRGCHCNRVCL